MKLLRTADVRKILDQLGREEITYSKMVDLLNEKANERLKQNLKNQNSHTPK